jgi:RimJ/RimL family protein N-acetyltransferase
MEKMPYLEEVDRSACLQATTVQPVTGTMVPPSAGMMDPADWRSGLPVLSGVTVTLRELRTSDAPALFAMLTTEEVARFISPPPATVQGFERFIGWAMRQRLMGTYACFAVTLAGTDEAIGIFQLRELDPGFGTAEWGFAIGSPYWGSGAFSEGAELVAAFAFDVVGVHRLEARAAVKNGRGNGALRKIGAVQDGVLRKSLLKNGEYLDQVLWTILAGEWHRTRVVWGPLMH